jgi:hypothetical protein
MQSTIWNPDPSVRSFRISIYSNFSSMRLNKILYAEFNLIIAHVSVNIFYSAMLLLRVSPPIRHLHGGQLKRIYIIHAINIRQDYWIGHILRRNCLLKQVTEWRIEGSIEVMGRRGRRCKQLLDNLKGKRGYWKFEEEALDRTVWWTRFGRGWGTVVRQTAAWMTLIINGVVDMNMWR